MVFPAATKLIEWPDEEYKWIGFDVRIDIEWGKWWDFVDGGNGCFYGIPFNARRVVEYDVEDKSINEIGPDLGNQLGKYINGIKAGSGSIYCMPCEAEYILKIIPGEGKYASVQVLEEIQVSKIRWRNVWDFPFARGNMRFRTYLLKNMQGRSQNAKVQTEESQLPSGGWKAGALANDGCIYYLSNNPDSMDRILKLDPNDGDRLSLVGRFSLVGGEIRNDGDRLSLLGRLSLVRKEIRGGCSAAALGNDGYIYGISNRNIIKFSPIDHSISYVGGCFENTYVWTEDVIAYDGNIYAANQFGQILKIEPADKKWSIIGTRMCDGSSWGRPVLGANKCIYFPPLSHDQVLKFNPATQKISLIGKSCGQCIWKWYNAVLASDGYIYCIPLNAKDILQIDSRHLNEQVLDMIENLKANDKAFVETTELKKRKRIS